MSLDDLLARSTESVDVLATAMLFWDHVITADVPCDDEQLIQQIHTVVSKGGVWYLAEVLPAEMSAHWVYSYFPELWEWARTRTCTLHTLFQQIQAVGFKPEVRRTRHLQPITLGAEGGLKRIWLKCVTSILERPRADVSISCLVCLILGLCCFLRI